MSGAGLDPLDGPDLPDFDAVHDDIVSDFGRGLLSTDEYYDRVAHVSGGRVSVRTAEQVLHAWTAVEYDGVTKSSDLLEEARIGTAVLSNAAH